MKTVENSYALASSVRDLNCRGIHLRWSFSLSLFDQRGSSAESKLSPYLRSLYMLLGMPFSQPCGAFQGRSDRLSDSVVAHPPKANPPKSSSSRNAQRVMEAILLTMQDGRE